MRPLSLLALIALATAPFGTLVAQQGGTVETIKLPAPSLAGNLQGNATERDVLVYLPPGYQADAPRRYPVVYQLHGWLPGAEQWSRMIRLKQGADNAIAAGTAREMIVVLPDAQSIFGGAMYSSSVTSGDFEGFIARDVVDYIDSHYRTIAERASRGLSGHSMGGYGTLRIAMKHPELYSSFYVMSACCLTPFTATDANIASASELTSLEEAKAAPIFVRVQLTQGAAWSPNPTKPPLYLDMPLQDGEVQPLILAKWDANTPLAMIDQYIPELRQYDAIGLDVGLQDGLLGANRELDQVLSDYGIEHSFGTYEGDHTSGVAERFEGWVLPFFSEHLAFE
jgi:enterochelin esterase-like enzyme